MTSKLVGCLIRQHIHIPTPHKPLLLARHLSSSASSHPSTSPSPRRQSSQTKEATTHFGFEEVPLDEKEKLVHGVFQNVASHYDIMNDLMSGGLHRLWKDELVNITGVGPMAAALRCNNVVHDHSSSSVSSASSASSASTPSSSSTNKPGRLLSILDVAGGTGDVAFRFLEAAKCPQRALSSGHDEIAVTVCDINPHMLAVGQRRAKDRYGPAVLESSRALTFVQGNAQNLRPQFPDDAFDIYTIAFGLRNVTEVDLALQEAFRVLKPGGRYLCLEFSKVDNPLLKNLYDTYSFNVIPTVGDVVAGDRESYRYLVESIRQFSDQKQLKQKMQDVGFIHCKYTNMTGGIVAVHEGWKPLHS